MAGNNSTAMDINLNIKSFGQRVGEALYFKEITDLKIQILFLSKACGVTTRTASSYLTADKCPMSNYPVRLLNLAKALGVETEWLFLGKGLGPFEAALMSNMASMNKWQRNKMLRCVIRQLNNDKKVQRLIKLRDEGFISVYEFLRQM